MKVRVIQLLNNYYRDKEEERLITINKGDSALGEYCCLGHFDAMNIKLVNWEENQNVRIKLNKILAETFKGSFNIRNVVCVTYDDEKDEKFWIEAERKPFLFVSLASIRYENGRLLGNINQLIQKFNKKNNVIAYYTYDHSEIIVIRAEKKYIEGYKKMLFLYEQMEIFKMYTIFAIRENALERCENIQREIIKCRLSGIVKDWKEVELFKTKLYQILERENQDIGLSKKEKIDIKMYKTLGERDCLIEISSISIKSILYCYKMDRLLTHTNEFYKRAFFNIESQFLIEGEKKWINGRLIIWQYFEKYI